MQNQIVLLQLSQLDFNTDIAHITYIKGGSVLFLQCIRDAVNHKLKTLLFSLNSPFLFLTYFHD